MKFAHQPFAGLNHLILAGLFAATGTSAMAQTAPVAPTVTTKPASPPGEHMGRHDPAKMQAMMAKRQADMKARLKITPAQEGAWTSYTTAMQPPANMGGRYTPEQRAEFDKLTTPERIDKMRAMRTQRMADRSAAMDKRGEATKTFYATLTPEQQKVFDTEHKKHMSRGGPGHHGAAGPMEG